MQKFIQFSLITIMALDIIALGFLLYLNSVSQKALDPSNREPILFEVKSGEGAGQIIKNLKSEGIIASEMGFKYYVWQDKSANLLKAGNYELSKSMTIPQIVEVLKEGHVVQNGECQNVKITIPEGYRTSEVESTIIAAGLDMQEGELVEAVEVPANLAYEIFNYRFLNELPPRATIDGFLFPDTYCFMEKAQLNDVATRMLGNFEEKITDAMRVKYKAMGKNLYEIIIMASIIEKEVQTTKDMKIVSGVLWKRMEIGMPLQVDATLLYVTGKGAGELTNDDKLIDSPYNTYKYRGLPPTPIANPGLRAIEAAIEPTESDYLYYLSTPEGETIFSKTNDEHNENRARYLYTE